jgi:ABC-2 type transport system ATP-binding protein
MRLGAQEAGLDVELRMTGADEATLAGLARFGERIERADGVVSLRVASDDRLPEIADWLVGRGARLYEMRSARKSLETWFLEVMGEDQRPG